MQMSECFILNEWSCLPRRLHFGSFELSVTMCLRSRVESRAVLFRQAPAILPGEKLINGRGRFQTTSSSASLSFRRHRCFTSEFRREESALARPRGRVGRARAAQEDESSSPESPTSAPPPPPPPVSDKKAAGSSSSSSLAIGHKTRP